VNIIAYIIIMPLPNIVANPKRIKKNFIAKFTTIKGTT
jgi:hypothetical protein